jgi:hypothetical protein
MVQDPGDQKRKVSALAISDSRLTRFSAQKRKTTDAKPDDKNQRVEIAYPESIKPASSRATAACYQDFVDIFCKGNVGATGHGLNCRQSSSRIQIPTGQIWKKHRSRRGTG